MGTMITNRTIAVLLGLLAVALPGGASAQEAGDTGIGVGGVPQRLYRLSIDTTLKLADGTAGALALAFTLDPDTGIYRSGENTMELMTGGATRLTIGAVHVTASGNVTAGGFVGSGLYASGEGVARHGVTVNGKNASYATTTLTGGVDLGHTFYLSTDFGAADKVLQWGDAGTVELGSCFGDGNCQFDGTITSDGTGTSDFDGPVAAPGFVPDKCDSTGTPGAATCNTYAGRAAIAAAASSVVITDSLVTATSSVFAQLATADATCLVVRRVVPAAGSFTIAVDAACTAAANVAWEVR